MLPQTQQVAGRLAKTNGPSLYLIAQKTAFIPCMTLPIRFWWYSLVKTMAFGTRLLVNNLPEVIIAASCSKNFGLYRERVGLALNGYRNSSVNAQCYQTQSVHCSCYFILCLPHLLASFSGISS